MLIPQGQRAVIKRTADRAGVPATKLQTVAVSEFDGRAGDPTGLNTIIEFLWQRKLTIAGCVLAGLLTAVVVSMLMKPVYRARTSLQLEGFNDDALHSVSPVSTLLPNASPENYLQNEVKLLESNTLAKRVADELGIAAPSGGATWLNRFVSLIRPGNAKDPALPDEQRIARVSKALTVQTSLESQVIELYYSAPDPVMAARGANAAAAAFMNLNRETRWQLIQDTTEWLNKQASELKVKLENANQQLQSFADRAGLIVEGNQNTPAEDRLRQIQDAYTRAQADRAARQAAYEAALSNSSDLIANSAGSPLQQYQTQLQTLRQQLAEMRSTFTPDYYKVKQLQAQVTETEDAIAKERTRTLGQMRTAYQAAAGLEQMLYRSLSSAMRTVQHQTEGERRYDVLKNEVETTQKLYDSVLEKAKSAGAESSLRMTNVRVIDAAMPPAAPYSPNLALNLSIGLALGLVGGVGLTLLGARPGKVSNPAEMVQINFRELGVVPSARPSDGPWCAGPSALGIWETDQPSLLKESFRAALTSVLFSAHTFSEGQGEAARARSRVFVVTSVGMGEGKTTIVTNLGIASAERRHRVLLIDGDLRRPQLHARLHLSNQRGLADLLEQQAVGGLLDDATLGSFVQATGIRNLSVLTSGCGGAASPNLLYSADLSSLLERFGRRFEIILIDAPPMLVYSDARILGGLSDGVLMVVRANQRSREELNAAYQQLTQDHIPVLGAILNDWRVDPGQARAYDRHYSHYSEGAKGVAS